MNIPVELIQQAIEQLPKAETHNWMVDIQIFVQVDEKEGCLYFSLNRYTGIWELNLFQSYNKTQF